MKFILCWVVLTGLACAINAFISAPPYLCFADGAVAGVLSIILASIWEKSENN